MSEEELIFLITQLESFDPKLVAWVEVTAGAKPGTLIRKLKKDLHGGISA